MEIDVIISIARVISLLVFMLYCVRIAADSYRCTKSGNWLIRIIKHIVASPADLIIVILTPIFFYYTIISSSQSIFLDLKAFVIVKAPNFLQIFQETIGIPLAAYIALEMLADAWNRNSKTKQFPTRKEII